MSGAANDHGWLQKSERGSPAAIKLIVWIALTLGRSVARAILHPVCVYYFLSSPGSRAASRQFLTRALGRAPRLAELYRHHFYFAACVLDRVFFLNGQFERFDVHVHDRHGVTGTMLGGAGCILLGAHFGSFEAIRALGRTQPALRVALLMYQENARSLRDIVAAINPALAAEIIDLGTPDSMLKVMESLDAGALIGILADRSFEDEGRIPVPFLGQTAAFPLGPFRLARVLRRPILLMLGVYSGGSRYDIHFELLGDWSQPGADRSAAAAEAMLRHYVARLEYYARAAPFNWFNFYDFWK